MGSWAVQTAHRLDRLHVRYDLSWQALDGALARRAVVARAVAVAAYGGGGRGAPPARAPRGRGGAAETDWPGALAVVDPAPLPVPPRTALGGGEARGFQAR